MWNTFLQAVLSGFMWGLNRYKRPSWSTGLFVALACIVAACGGIMSFVEGKKVKSIVSLFSEFLSAVSGCILSCGVKHPKFTQGTHSHSD